MTARSYPATPQLLHSVASRDANDRACSLTLDYFGCFAAGQLCRTVVACIALICGLVASGGDDLLAHYLDLSVGLSQCRHHMQVFELGGNMVAPSLADNLMRLVAEGAGEGSDEADAELRSQAAASYLSLLSKPKLPNILLKVLSLSQSTHLSVQYWCLQNVLAQRTCNLQEPSQWRVCIPICVCLGSQRS